MAGIERFEDIEAWQLARRLAFDIHRLLDTSPINKHFALRDQLSRAVISISANIAEGFARNGDRDFAHFLDIAKGSCAEVQSLLYLAYDLRYCEKAEFAKLYKQANETASRIGAFIVYLRSGKPHRSKPAPESTPPVAVLDPGL